MKRGNGEAEASELSALPNIGKVTERWLHGIGVHDEEDLRRMGAVQAYRLIRARESSATENQRQPAMKWHSEHELDQDNCQKHHEGQKNKQGRDLGDDDLSRSCWRHQELFNRSRFTLFHHRA